MRLDDPRDSHALPVTPARPGHPASGSSDQLTDFGDLVASEPFWSERVGRGGAPPGRQGRRLGSTGGSGYGKWMPAAISMTMIAATTQSTIMQNGGHHRVLATKWRRCCQRSFQAVTDEADN